MLGEHDITALLQQVSAGQAGAFEALFGRVYAELRGMARAQLAGERADHTLQPTALVHEAYLRLVDQDRAVWQNRGHFLAVASQAMRRILVDHARGRSRQKRGGGLRHLPLEAALVLGDETADPLVLALDSALSQLEGLAPAAARVVELRFFGGLTQDECADLLGVSRRTVCRHWDYAQAWLFRAMQDAEA